MGCGVEGACPATRAPTEDWGPNDPKGQPIGKGRQIRGEIAARVAKLLGDLPE